MKIYSSEYIKSFADIRAFDIPLLPAIAFAGRSNVGKSSLMNHLLNRKRLVKTSSIPGKTQLLKLMVRRFSLAAVEGAGFQPVPRLIVLCGFFHGL